MKDSIVKTDQGNMKIQEINEKINKKPLSKFH